MGTHSYLHQQAWLKTGFDLIKQVAPFDRDYLLPCGTKDLAGVIHQLARYEDAAGAGSALLGDLRTPTGDKLLDESLRGFWTEHSERNLLSSVLVFTGADKTQRDMVGRWKPEGSDVYMRTYNTLVAKLQKNCATHLTRAARFEDLGEEEIVQEANEWLVKRRGLTAEESSKISERLRLAMNRLPIRLSTQDELEPLQPNPCTPWDGFGLGGRVEASGDSDDSELFEEQALRPSAGFLVVFEGKKGRLHKSAGCWHSKSRRLNNTQWFESMPPDTSYHAVCKVCWPHGCEEPLASDSETQSSAGSVVATELIVVDG